MDKSLRGEMEAALDSLFGLTADKFIDIHETGTEDMASAARLALDLGHPLKECIYLALAMKMGCELLTSDRRFAQKAKSQWPKIRVLEG